MNFSGLSLDQAPPISAPLRFFLSAPIFGFLAALLLFFVDANSLMNRFSSETVLFVHLITIGVFAMVMLGALQQMLPVLAGVSLPYSLRIARFSHMSLVIGLLSFVWGMFSGNRGIIMGSEIALGLGFFLLLGAIAFALKKVVNFNATVRSITVSVIIAMLVVGLGLFLLEGHRSLNMLSIHYNIVDIHATLAIFGFAGLLVIGVSFQVLPMFYVAPRFKAFCKKYVLWLIVSGLLVWSGLQLLYPEAVFVGKLIIITFFFAFATTVLKKLKERRRPVSDVTIWYWKTGAISLIAGLFFWGVNDLIAVEMTPVIAIAIGGGFLLSIISGMLYKIIPFLVWFHLNSSGYMSIPTMKEMIIEPLAKVQYVLFITALMMGIGSYYFPLLLDIAALSLALSFILLEYNLIKAVMVYVKTRQKAPDFEMPIVNAS